MVKLTAKRRMQYAGRRLVAGDVFEARSNHARVLMLLNRAAIYVEPVKPKRRRAAERADEQVVEQIDETVIEPGEYLRRDMRAED